MSVTASVAIAAARTHLNDDEGSKWPDWRILPKLQEAYRDMIGRLLRAESPITYAVNSILTVPAISIDDNNVDMSAIVGYPTDMIAPIWMKERTPGQTQQDFVDMKQCDFIPQVKLSQSQLIWWCWIDGKIQLRGCLTPIQVQLRYLRNLTPPVKLTDDLVVTQAENFLSYRTAALCLASSGDMSRADYYNMMAENNIDVVLAITVKLLQGMPAKRGPYHRGRGRNRVLRDF